MWFANARDFLVAAHGAILEARRYLSERKSGRPGEGTVVQLEELLRYLEAMERNVDAGTLPPKRDRLNESRAWILVDSWNYHDPLGLRIMELDADYQSM